MWPLSVPLLLHTCRTPLALFCLPPRLKSNIKNPNTNSPFKNTLTTVSTLLSAKRLGVLASPHNLFFLSWHPMPPIRQSGSPKLSLTSILLYNHLTHLLYTTAPPHSHSRITSLTITSHSHLLCRILMLMLMFLVIILMLSTRCLLMIVCMCNVSCVMCFVHLSR